MPDHPMVPRHAITHGLLVMLLAWSSLLAHAQADIKPFIAVDVHYQVLDAGEVMLLWGVNGWQPVPEAVRPHKEQSWIRSCRRRCIVRGNFSR